MKALAVVLSLFVLLVGGCGGGGGGGDDAPPPAQCAGEVIAPLDLTIGVPLDQTIEAFGTKYYIFEVVDPATYTISLYNMATDNDWVLIEYVSNCEDDYPLEPLIFAESSNLSTDDDIQSVSLVPKTYLLIVDEYDDLPSSYTVSVVNDSSPTPNSLQPEGQCVGEVIAPLDLTIGVPLNQTIEASGTKYYVFEVADPATYTISLYNMVTKNDWTLIEYVSNCGGDYPLDVPIIAESYNDLANDGTLSVSLDPKKYLLIVDEYDDQPSSYTVSLTR